MILDFACKNVYSFAEGIEVSFRKKDDIVHLLGVKGANGSGKTNLLRALSFLLNFAAHSFSLKPEDETGIVPFFDSASESNFKISFSYDLAEIPTEYIYELALNKQEVIYESLRRKVKREQLLWERKGNITTYTIEEFADVRRMKFRKNASAISTAHQYELSPMEEIYDQCAWVIDNVQSISFATLFLNCNPDIYGKEGLSRITEIYHTNQEKFDFAKKFISSCDIGISDIIINKETLATGKDIFIPYFIHKNNGEAYPLPYQAESAGTQFLFAYLWLIHSGTIGFTVIFDELDMSLHPHIIPKILDLFNPEKYPRCGQLIFTTHNIEIMDTLQKEEVFLLNKEDNESFGYRLDALPAALVRKDRSFSKPYFQGKLGGVPKL